MKAISTNLLCAGVILGFVLTVTSCSRIGQAGDVAKVKDTFESCKAALLSRQIDQAMGCFSRNAFDYLNRLNSNQLVFPAPAGTSVPSETPTVDLLLRTALEKRVPVDVRPTLTLDSLMQRISDKRLLNLRDIQQLSLGRISINGNTASAEIDFAGNMTALRLPFIKEGDQWKIDIMSILPYAEVLMRLDRAVKRETADEQVEQLVSKLPSL